MSKFSAVQFSTAYSMAHFMMSEPIWKLHIPKWEDQQPHPYQFIRLWKSVRLGVTSELIDTGTTMDLLRK